MAAMIERINVLIQYKDLLRELVVRDVKLKYRRSFLGYLWSILSPLLIMIVMTIVFSQMFDRGIENFPVYLLTGSALFEFVNGSTHMAMYSVLDNSALLKKIYVPKYIFTLAKITSSMVDLVFSMGALFLVMLVTRAHFSLYMLLIPVVIVQIYLFACGLGFFLSAANVFFRDVQYIYNAFTTAWMYLTPIFYPIEMLDKMEWVRWIITHLNPMYYYIQHFRDLVLYGRFTDASIFWGGWLFSFIVLFIGLFVFKKTQDKFILYV